MNREELRHKELKERLAARGESLSTVARRLDVASSTVTIVSKGFRRSRRIEAALAEAVGSTPAQLWPERYSADEGGSTM